MTSKKLSKAAQQGKDGDADSLSSASTSTTLSAIKTQGNDLKRLIEDTKLSINTRLDAVDAMLANLQSDQSGVKKKVEDLELAMTGCDSRLDEVERIYRIISTRLQDMHVKLTASGSIRKGPRHKKPQIEAIRVFVLEFTSSPSGSSAPIKDQNGRVFPTQEEREEDDLKKNCVLST
ncbi:hypothetical protein G5714_015549 [Onychostoma macrolepis]|uniref:Uncharacterized protein n=1 Tax=Onychostoma macrolepis TaxID=369639 RepID=A0A7J6C627_9TELE|nr:hypothetical protein G5714_015549 [Onychostoma macrolepis]